MASLLAASPQTAAALPPPKPRPNRALPAGKQWIGFCGNQARMRYLRQSYRKVAKLTDPASVAARERVVRAVANEPDPVYGVMHLTHVALQAAEGTRSSWAESMNFLLDKFEERVDAPPES